MTEGEESVRLPVILGVAATAFGGLTLLVPELPGHPYWPLGALAAGVATLGWEARRVLRRAPA